MVVGIGNDLLHIERMAKTYERTQGRIAQRILGQEEYQVFLARKTRNAKRGMAYLCTRFAAKEAFSKGIGLGMRYPMTWQSVQTLNETSGKPYLKYSGALAQFMQERGWSAQVTITDEIEMVSAVVIVTKDA
ncbi:MAG: holo-ACP synthase [Betaproteobacteria bacterium]